MLLCTYINKDIFSVFRNFTLSLFALPVFLFLPSVVHAQSAGAQILPALFEETVNPGDAFERKMTVRNVSTSDQVYYLLKKDITGVRDDNSPMFANEHDTPTGYELSSWVSLSEEPITLAPGGSAVIPIKVSVPTNASPGSHFGGVFVSVQAPRMRQTGASVGYEVGTILSIRIRGDVVENARVRSFSTDRLIYSKPLVNFVTRVENSGNVLIRPRGILEVFNMFGKRVTLLNVNENRGAVFPGTTRSYETIWDDKDFAFGRYQGIVSLIYGEQGHETTVSGTVSFWVLPINIILPVIGLLAFFVLATYFSVRWHIRRTLSTYQVAGKRSAVYKRRDTGMTRLTMITIALLAVIAVFLVAMLVIFA